MPIDMTELIHTADLQSSIKNETISLHNVVYVIVVRVIYHVDNGRKFHQTDTAAILRLPRMHFLISQSRGHGSISITLGHFRSPQRLVKLSEFWVPPHLPSLIQGLSVKRNAAPRNRTVPALRHRTSLQGEPCFPDDQIYSTKTISADFKDSGDTESPDHVASYVPANPSP